MSRKPHQKFILLIGPRPPPSGGATVLFEELLGILGRTAAVDHIDTNGEKRKHGAALGTLNVIRKIFVRRKSIEFMSLHASIRAALLFGPVVALLAKVLGVPWSLRLFGGQLDRWLDECGFVSRWFFHRFAQSPAIFFVERKSTVRVLDNFRGVRSMWLPNSRPFTRAENSVSRPSARERAEVKFVFVGHVKPSKGVREIVRAARLLGERRFSVDFYGPLLEGITAAELNEGQCHYQRELRPEEVISTMQNYDVLLLPTYWRGEGYPGVIIEAFGCGLAVIASDWGGIPELVSQHEGILVAPRSEASLAKAMATLIEADGKLDELREGSRKAAQAFSSEVWAARFLEAHHRWLREKIKGSVGPFLH